MNMQTEKRILAEAHNKKGEKLTACEIIEGDEMTCVGVYFIFDGEWFEYPTQESAIAAVKRYSKN